MRMAQSGPTVAPEFEAGLPPSSDTTERAWPSEGLTGTLCAVNVGLINTQDAVTAVPVLQGL